jgi:succinate dehydrogenase hydrophobic anchor subunit
MNLIKPVYASITNPILNNSWSIASNPQGYINQVLQTVFSIFFIVAVIYFIWHIVMAAYHMISSQGEPEKWKLAQSAIIHAFVGLLLVFSIFAILKFVGAVLGIQGLQSLQLIWPSLSN